MWSTFKSQAKKEVKSELKSQGKEAAEGELAGLIDGMSQDEFANHFCMKEGWEGACWAHPSTFPPNVQKGPGNRCDCTPGHCWEWTGKKDPWYAYGWECTKQKANTKKWVTQQWVNAAKSQSGTPSATQSPPPPPPQTTEQFEEEVLPAIYGGVGGLIFIICICLACCCLRSRKKSAQQSVEQMVNQRMVEQIVNQRMAQHTQAWEKDRN